MKKEIIDKIGIDEYIRLFEKLNNIGIDYDEERDVFVYYVPFSCSDFDDYLSEKVKGICVYDLDCFIEDIAEDFYLFDDVDYILYEMSSILGELNLHELVQRDVIDIVFDYSEFKQAVYNTEICTTITLQTKSDLNGLNSHQMIKKYIPKLWKEIRDNEAYKYYEYNLCCTLVTTVPELFDIACGDRRIKLKGDFVLADVYNGSYYDYYSEALGQNIIDGIELEITVSGKSIRQELNYCIEDISDWGDYECRVVK